MQRWSLLENLVRSLFSELAVGQHVSNFILMPELFASVVCTFLLFRRKAYCNCYCSWSGWLRGLLQKNASFWCWNVLGFYDNGPLFKCFIFMLHNELRYSARVFWWSQSGASVFIHERCQLHPTVMLQPKSFLNFSFISMSSKSVSTYR